MLTSCSAGHRDSSDRSVVTADARQLRPGVIGRAIRSKYAAGSAVPRGRAAGPSSRARAATHRRSVGSGTRSRSAASPPKPMLDSPGLRIAVRRDPPTVEDLRSTTVSDDPVQRRDLILLERARDGDLGAFNDLVVLYQDQLFALVVRMVPDRDQASDAVQEAFFSAYRNLA